MSSSRMGIQLARRVAHPCPCRHARRARSRSLATVTSIAVDKPHRLSTAIILNRTPVITRTPTQFEQAFYRYQATIQRALHNPFPYELYFKQGSLLEARFNVEERRREERAFGRGFGVDPDGNSASAVGSGATETLGQEDEESMPRTTEADRTGDVKSLNRKLQRNLYLLVTKDLAKPRWMFPQGVLEPGELLHEAARRELDSKCGTSMDTWIVGRKPIGLYLENSPNSADTEFAGVKTFFLKAHIMAGQVKPDVKEVADFAWLTKNEIESRVENEYWFGVKDMLSDF